MTHRLDDLVHELEAAARNAESKRADNVEPGAEFWRGYSRAKSEAARRLDYELRQMW